MQIPALIERLDNTESWPGRDHAEHQRQWDAFRDRWMHDLGVRTGPLEVKRAQLDREPPFVVIGRENEDARVRAALGRGDTHVEFCRAEGGRHLSLAGAARALDMPAPEMARMRAVVLDGLEQSERVADRTPAQWPEFNWGSEELLPRFEDALAKGYVSARRSLEENGINPLAFQVDQPLRLSTEQVEHFAVLGRSATANASEVLQHGDRTEDLMVAVEVLAANPWDRSPFREGVDSQLVERLSNVGLRGIAPQARRSFPNGLGRGIGRNCGRVADLVESHEQVEEEGPSMRERNAERMQRQAPAMIRAEDPTKRLRRSGPKVGR